MEKGEKGTETCSPVDQPIVWAFRPSALGATAARVQTASGGGSRGPEAGYDPA